MNNTAVSVSEATCDSASPYENWLELIQKRFASIGNTPLFATDASDLWQAYLDGFDSDHRQVHNCSTCRHFIQRYGGLVTIDERGNTKPVFWIVEDAPAAYQPGVAALRQRVQQAKITGVFLSSREGWGTGVTGPWKHLAVSPLRDRIHRNPVLPAAAAIAEKREDHKNVTRALAEFSAAVIAQALSLLNSDSLYRSEKVIGPAKWLAELHESCNKGKAENVIWRAVATAPAGFCHPRSSMIGSLLEDLASGLPFTTVSRRFADKMHPLSYQRPQAAPSAGTIIQAEKLVAQLGIARSLERRFARADEIQTVWASKPAPKPRGGVFGHLLSKGKERSSKLNVPAQVITWEKFSRTVLHGATSMELMVPNSGDFTAIVTAEHFDAPPILQWDTQERRNPFSWYLYSGGSSAKRWGLHASTWCTVTAITLKPSLWFGGFDHQGIGAVFILEGAKDADNRSACLFPEFLKPELHGVRSVIEAHSRTAKLGGKAEASACGMLMGKNSAVHVRVTDGTGVWREYKLDRWD